MRKVWIVLFLATVLVASTFAITYEEVLKIMQYYNVPEQRAKLLAEVIIEESVECPAVDPLIILAVIASETGFRNIYGDNGRAVGYMQLHQSAAWYVANFYPEVKDFLRKVQFKDLIKFPAMQIRIGYRYLYLLTKFVYNGNIVSAINAYNGRGDLKYYRRVLEHQLFLLKILQY